MRIRFFIGCDGVPMGWDIVICFNVEWYFFNLVLLPALRQDARIRCRFGIVHLRAGAVKIHTLFARTIVGAFDLGCFASGTCNRGPAPLCHLAGLLDLLGRHRRMHLRTVSSD